MYMSRGLLSVTGGQESIRGVRLVEKAMEGLWTVFLWFWGAGGTSSNSPLL